MRFKNIAWRLLQLMPCNLKFIKSSLDRVKLWHLSAGLSFQNYNKQLETGTLIECSDGKVRDCVFVLCQLQADQPEADCCNCSVQVRAFQICMLLYMLLYTRFADVALYTGKLPHVHHTQANVG